MRGNPKWILAFVWRKFGGVCQNCFEPTRMVRDCRTQLGWRVDLRTGYVYHSILGRHRIATVEHIKPKCIGGRNNPENLTLYCEQCRVDLLYEEQETRSVFMRMKNKGRKRKRRRS